MAEEKAKTVLMRKGDLYAHIYNSEECINTATNEGYILVDGEEPKKVVKETETTENVTETAEETKTVSKRGRKSNK